MLKTTTSKNLHPVAEMYADEHKAGHMDRREFMSRATALGVSATAAYGMLGLATPAQAGSYPFISLPCIPDYLDNILIRIFSIRTHPEGY